MMAPDAWSLLFDRLDRIDRGLEALDGRLREVESDCAEIKAMQQAAKSRISQEVRAQTEADESLHARVAKLELDSAESKGASRGAWKLYLAIAAAAGTTSGGALKALGAIFGT